MAIVITKKQALRGTCSEGQRIWRKAFGDREQVTLTTAFRGITKLNETERYQAVARLSRYCKADKATMKHALMQLAYRAKSRNEMRRIYDWLLDGYWNKATLINAAIKAKAFGLLKETFVPRPSSLWDTPMNTAAKKTNPPTFVSI